MALDEWGVYGYEQGDLVRLASSGTWGIVISDGFGIYGGDGCSALDRETWTHYLVRDDEGGSQWVRATDLDYQGEQVCHFCGARWDGLDHELSPWSAWSILGSSQVGEQVCKRCASQLTDDCRRLVFSSRALVLADVAEGF